MLKRTNKLLIGKDIARASQAAVVAGASLAEICVTGATGIDEGEVVVLDKFKKVLAAGSTIVDTDSIFICQATGQTFDYTNEQSTLISSNRKLLFSNKIEGAKVRKFLGRSHVVKAEQVTTFTPVTDAVVATEYIIRIVYKDIKEHPGQFTQTYRFTATVATMATLLAGLMAKINADSDRRVQASDGTTALVLTGREIPESCSSLTDIDKFKLVEFDAYFLRIDSDGNWASAVDGTGITTVAQVETIAPTFGSGNWEQIRDIEKDQLGHIGITNRTQFPIVSPDMSTVVDETYDLVIIEHDASYLAPNSQGFETTGLTTEIALAIGATGDQTTQLLAQLNPWMASCPGAFETVSV